MPSFSACLACAATLAAASAAAPDKRVEIAPGVEVGEFRDARRPFPSIRAIAHSLATLEVCAPVAYPCHNARAPRALPCADAVRQPRWRHVTAKQLLRVPRPGRAWWVTVGSCSAAIPPADPPTCVCVLFAVYEGPRASEMWDLPCRCASVMLCSGGTPRAPVWQPPTLASGRLAADCCGWLFVRSRHGRRPAGATAAFSALPTHTRAGLDTALTYGDAVQQKVATAMAHSSTKRADIFLTTKVRVRVWLTGGGSCVAAWQSLAVCSRGALAAEGAMFRSTWY